MGISGMFSVAAFVKDIRNEIFTSSATGSPKTYAGTIST